MANANDKEPGPSALEIQISMISRSFFFSSHLSFLHASSLDKGREKKMTGTLPREDL
jgi:hypothetical protein